MSLNQDRTFSMSSSKLVSEIQSKFRGSNETRCTVLDYIHAPVRPVFITGECEIMLFFERF